MRIARATSTTRRKLSSWSSELLLWLFGFDDLFHHESFHATELLLKASGETARAVFEKNDETKGEENEKDDPKYPAEQSHGRKPN